MELEKEIKFGQKAMDIPRLLAEGSVFT